VEFFETQCRNQAAANIEASPRVSHCIRESM